MSTTRQGPAKSRRYSAGIVLFRLRDAAANPGRDDLADEASSPTIEVLLGHMGGPLWQRRDVGAWSIPKGGYEDDEEPLAAARREFVEETSLPLPEGPMIELGTVIQSNNKAVIAWAIEGDADASAAVSNLFELEWPPRSGQIRSFPEFDRLEWLSLDAARARIVTAQATLLDRLAAHLRKND